MNAIIRSYNYAKNLLGWIFDAIAPGRADFVVVSNMSADDFLALPKANQVKGLPWISSLYAYRNNAVRAIIWELKYKNNTIPLRHIAPTMYEEITALMSDIATFDTDARFILIPVPISDERRRERGYNQSEYICRAIVENDLGRTLLYAPQWLQKIKDTPRQSKSSSREERFRNLLGCFEADQRVSGGTIILVDDVVTTGSTLSEARKTLLEAGAKDVFALTIAH